MLIEGAVFLIVLAVWWISHDRKKYKGFPPGPPRFPVIGNLPQLLTKSPLTSIAFKELAKSYGDIMFLKIGTLDTVVVSSHERIVDIFEKTSYRASFKVPLIADRLMWRNLGLVLSNGDTWGTTRRFTLRTLREFGFGKSLSMDFVINQELEKLKAHVDKLIDANNNVLSFEGFFDSTVLNVIWRLVTGINYSFDDPRINYLLKINNEHIHSTSFSFDLSIAFPRLREWFPELLFGKKEQLRIINDLHKFARDTIQEHREAGNYSFDPKCFVDVFLGKIDEQKEDPYSHFHDDNLIMTILDLFQAGAETTSKTLSFGILYMILYPAIQEKVWKEIKSVVAPNEPITISLKPQLPYCCATVMEVLRYTTVVPFPPMREATEDFYFKGYYIKKGTVLMQNLYAAHFSTEVWGDPIKFRPERFLTPEGKVDSKMENFLMSFGGGKRICVAKTLAEASLFLYFTKLIRDYKFCKVPGTPDPSTVPIPGMTYAPQPFNAQVFKRQVDSCNISVK